MSKSKMKKRSGKKEHRRNCKAGRVTETQWEKSVEKMVLGELL